MAAEWDIYLGTTGPTGELPRTGRKTSIMVNELVREDRALDGTLHQDCIYVKHEFVLDYSLISGTDIEVLDYWYAYYKTYRTPLTLYMYTGPAAYDTYTVVPKPVDRTRAVQRGDNLYSGVSFKMIEV